MTDKSARYGHIISYIYGHKLKQRHKPAKMKLLLVVLSLISLCICDNAHQNDARKRRFFKEMLESMVASGMLMMDGAGYIMSQGAHAMGDVLVHGEHHEIVTTTPKSILLSTPVPKTETETTARTTTALPTTEKTTTATVQVSTSQSSCSDDTPYCSDLGKSICESNRDFAETHCRRYCGICGVETTTPNKLQWVHVNGRK